MGAISSAIDTAANLGNSAITQGSSVINRLAKNRHVASAMAHGKGAWGHAVPGIIAGGIAGGVTGGVTAPDGFKNRTLGALKGMGIGAAFGGAAGAATYGANRLASMRPLPGKDFVGPLQPLTKLRSNVAKSTQYMEGAHLGALGVGAGIGSYATLRSNRGY